MNDKFRIHKCTMCDNQWMTHSEKPFCSNCAMKKLYLRLPALDVSRIEKLIYGNEILIGIKYIKEYLRISLSESLELFEWIYRQLRASRPEYFRRSEQEYWNGF